MGSKIYWKQYDKPVKVFDPIMKVEREIIGKFICEDERIIHFDFVGAASFTSPLMKCMAIFIFKDGRKEETEIDLFISDLILSESDNPAKTQQDFYILQAEQFLSTL